VDRSGLPSRVIRLKRGELWPDDDRLADGLTMAERLELVWTLTKQA
jgi:hypothetical protein